MGNFGIALTVRLKFLNAKFRRVYVICFAANESGFPGAVQALEPALRRGGAYPARDRRKTSDHRS